jgi:hypothetical protein
VVNKKKHLNREKVRMILCKELNVLCQKKPWIISKRGQDIKVVSEINREERIGNVIILDTRRRVGRGGRMRRERVEEVVVLVV